MNAIRLAAATTVITAAALLSVATASGKPPAPPINVACGQQALVDAINAANSAGGGIASASLNPDFSPSSTVATLTVRNSWVSDNQQTLDGPDGGAGGGGILNLDGTAMLDHTQVNGNIAEGFFGGGIASGDYFGLGGETSLTIDHSQVN